MTTPRTGHAVAKAIRTALATPVFPAGVYSIPRLREILVDYGTVTAFELAGRDLGRLLNEVPGWSHNGHAGPDSRWTKAAQPVIPQPRLVHPAEDEPQEGPVTSTIKRMERKINALLAAQGLNPGDFA